MRITNKNKAEFLEYLPAGTSQLCRSCSCSLPRSGETGTRFQSSKALSRSVDSREKGTRATGPPIQISDEQRSNEAAKHSPSFSSHKLTGFLFILELPFAYHFPLQQREFCGVLFQLRSSPEIEFLFFLDLVSSAVSFHGSFVFMVCNSVSVQ
jgi:hypothetical protein